MTKKNVVVFGAGAIGSCMSAYLTRGGVELTIIDPWFAHILAIQKRGLRVTAPEGEFTVKLRALHIDQVRDLGTPHRYSDPCRQVPRYRVVHPLPGPLHGPGWCHCLGAKRP